jgi:spore coat protein U-like protein
VSRRLAALALLLAPVCAGAGVSCRFVAAPGIAFGPYDTLSRVPTDTLTNIRVSCQGNGGPQNVTLSMRIGPSGHGGSVQVRRMRQVGGSGDFLGYGLYRDVSRSSVWGESDNVDTVAQTLSIPNRATQTAIFTIYARIPALQDVSAGTYADRLAITLMP